MRRSTDDIESEKLYDHFDITTLPRSIYPHLVVQNHRHVLPPTAAHNVMLEGHANEDDRLLRRLHEIKVNLLMRTLYTLVMSRKLQHFAACCN